MIRHAFSAPAYVTQPEAAPFLETTCRLMPSRSATSLCIIPFRSRFAIVRCAFVQLERWNHNWRAIPFNTSSREPMPENTPPSKLLFLAASMASRPAWSAGPSMLIAYACSGVSSVPMPIPTRSCRSGNFSSICQIKSGSTVDVVTRPWNSSPRVMANLDARMLRYSLFRLATSSWKCFCTRARCPAGKARDFTISAITARYWRPRRLMGDTVIVTHKWVIVKKSSYLGIYLLNQSNYTDHSGHADYLGLASLRVRADAHLNGSDRP